VAATAAGAHSVDGLVPDGAPIALQIRCRRAVLFA
jgi:hypothetical protein